MHIDLSHLPRPERGFASDNSSGAHPAVLAALGEANHGHVLAYGYDEHTARADAMFRELFDADVHPFYVWSGTGANVMSFASIARPADAVICTDVSHVNVDEAGAPERIAGTKLIDVANVDGKLHPADIEHEVHALGVEHHSQPAIVSITQSTELGTVYSPAEVRAIAETAHEHGMRVHMDGARIANATAALGGTPAALRSFTVDAGVDVISFGGTKNGMIHGEAVVYLDGDLASRAAIVRKHVGQLPSKVRFISAQFSALLSDGLWLENAGHSNALAARLHAAVADLSPLRLGPPPAVNSLFPRLVEPARQALRDWTPFYDWDASIDQVRWMTAWDSTDEDVDRMAAAIRYVTSVTT